MPPSDDRTDAEPYRGLRVAGEHGRGVLIECNYRRGKNPIHSLLFYKGNLGVVAYVQCHYSTDFVQQSGKGPLVDDASIRRADPSEDTIPLSY